MIIPRYKTYLSANLDCSFKWQKFAWLGRWENRLLLWTFFLPANIESLLDFIGLYNKGLLQQAEFAD